MNRNGTKLEHDSGPPYLVLLICAIAIGALGLAFWQSRNTQPPANTNTKAKGCSDEFAKSLAKDDGLPLLESCASESYTTDTNERITVFDVMYDAEDCTAQTKDCGLGGKFYYVKQPNQVIARINNTFTEPDLSLGSDNPVCKRNWTNDLSAMVRADPKHIKRSLIRQGETYAWRIELTGFDGMLPGGTHRDLCVRTGVLITNLEGTVLTIVGTPQFDIR